MKKLVVTSIVLIIVFAFATLHGNSVLARSNAYNQGYWDARNTYMNGDNFNGHCSFDHSDTHCFDYKLGYRGGWTATQLLH